MIPLFLGLTFANLTILLITFGMGLLAVDRALQRPTWVFEYHLWIGFVAGLMSLLTHIAVFMYFMATSRWLRAACEKAGLSLQTFVEPALKRKTSALMAAMSAIGVTMLTMFAGGGVLHPTRPLWPAEAHLTLATVTITVHILCALVQFRLIRAQSHLMDSALEKVNAPQIA